tara:strand:- start:23 stop:850 length:828 start_codon:yes stop_codon:yes gene_type:complete
MISIYLQGGLGNQLFQIFTAIAYSLKYKIPFKLPSNKNDLNSPYGEIYKRPLYFDKFLKNLKPFLTSKFQHQVLYRERGHFYTELPYCKENILLFGYFQSYKYFDSYKNDILKLIGFENYRKNNSHSLNNNTISIHFRIGDYVHATNAHPILKNEYYKNALNYILSKNENKNFTVVYYCENRDIEKVNINIKILKRAFPLLTFVKSKDNMTDWEEMISMSCCTHNIIANSTFSWWSGYLNENKEKIICYPNTWFGPALTKDTRDLFPNEWVKIKE